MLFGKKSFCCAPPEIAGFLSALNLPASEQHFTCIRQCCGKQVFVAAVGQAEATAQLFGRKGEVAHRDIGLREAG
jgi:hypothetical protein